MPGFLGKILIIDDDITVRRLLTVTLEAEQFQCDAVADLKGMRQAISERNYDAVLLDLILEHEDGVSAIPFLVREVPQTKIIMMSAHGTIEVAVSAMEQGATAFVSKSKDPQNIIAELKKRLTKNAVNLQTDNAYGIVGCSQAVLDIVERVKQVGSAVTNVLITGENGTGKELVARAIHQASDSSGKRFESVNCGTIPGPQLETELFGQNSRRSIFQICRNSTLLLQEIDQIPSDLQGKLLQVLNDQKLHSKDSSQALDVNCRIISTSSSNITDELSNGKILQDLYYRLAIVAIHLPPLRERIEDIPVLTKHFLEIYNEKFGKKVGTPNHELESRLNAYHWPGNVSELKNAVERGVLLSSDSHLKIEDMLLPSPEGSGDGNDNNDSFNKTLSEAKQEFERRYLQHLLEATRGNISEMARISGRYRTDIYRLLAKHGVDWEEFRPETDDV